MNKLIKSLLLLTLTFTSVVQAEEVPNRPYIIINGTAQKQVKPDILNLVIGVSQQNSNAEEAKKLVDKRVNDYFSFLEKRGVSLSDINAARFMLEPIYDYPDKKAPELKGYIAKREIKVILRQPEKISVILDDALAAGLNEIRSITPEASNIDKIQDEVRAAAVKDALRKATALAQGFSAKLGPVWSINYQQRAARFPVRMLSLARSNSEGEDNTWGQTMTVSDEVNVVFQLKTGSY